MLSLPLAALVALAVLSGAKTAVERAGFEFPTAPASAAPRSWRQAANLATEDRGEPTGRQAKVEVPDQLRHYSDKRRFLAIQVAERVEHELETPHDYAELASLIRAGALVEVPAASDNFVLIGVGGHAGEGHFTHFDKSAGESVGLYDEAELGGEFARSDETLARGREELDALRRESAALGRTERKRRAEILSQVATWERTLKTEREWRELIDEHYGDEAARRRMSDERASLTELASDFGGRTYDLTNARARKEMKVRMLSHLRPEALAVLEEVARSYRERFGRPLPVTSLVRPDEYQRQLGETNANATRIDTPPHSTGLAFDILYRHLTADEQAHVMEHLARLRDEARIEVLRENRDHFHVFAFVDGKRPGESLISGSLGTVAASASRAKAAPEDDDDDEKSKMKTNEKASAKSKAAEKKSVASKAGGKAAEKRKAAAKPSRSAARKRR
ncbi:MAG TPA: DUF5715 family protein [Pyrinomonadaceae bacterium]|nr:DUF5715 family protein [Pyrinomonadaceae bacterium]